MYKYSLLLAFSLVAVYSFGMMNVYAVSPDMLRGGDIISTSTQTGSVFGSSTNNVLVATTSTPVAGLLQIEKKDVTVPEEGEDKDEVFKLLSERPVTEISLFNFFPYWVQEAIRLGIPANTIILILLVPILATIVVFVRLVVGLPSLEMLVPVILSFTFIALGITVGLGILVAIVSASFFSRMLLRRLSIMHLPKRSVSLFILSLFVFATLIASVVFDVGNMQNVSIFPVIILILLGDKIVSVLLRKSIQETALITGVTIVLGILGYYLAVSSLVRDSIILYPEIVLLVIPLNILMGRYFGMRLTEYFRFKTSQPYGVE